MSKPVRARTWRPSLPRPAGGPDGAGAARRVARAGRAAIRCQHLSSLRNGAEGLCLGVASSQSGHLRGTGPGSATWKDPDPRRRSSRGSGGSEQACLPGDGGSATPAACPVSTTSWRYGLRRTCRLVTGRSQRSGASDSAQLRLGIAPSRPGALGAAGVVALSAATAAGHRRSCLCTCLVEQHGRASPADDQARGVSARAGRAWHRCLTPRSPSKWSIACRSWSRPGR